MVAAALGMLTLFVFPMWRITLIAPQYPNGVTMYIWINKLGGENPAVLQNINILNHYVGMKNIEPDAIPELKYFPFIVGGLVFLALLAAAGDKKWMFLSWGVLATLLAAAGLYDFYLWEYDYGHNLSPTAPIKVPGAVYQPPVIGSKTILNFIAKSFPHTGGYFAGLSILLAYAAYWLKRKTKKHETTSSAGVRRPARRVLQAVA